MATNSISIVTVSVHSASVDDAQRAAERMFGAELAWTRASNGDWQGETELSGVVATVHVQEYSEGLGEYGSER